MKSRISQSNNLKHSCSLAAASILVILCLAAAFFCCPKAAGRLILTDPRTEEEYASFPVKKGDIFSIGFIHSVNKSPVTDFYEIRDDGIYVVKTIYYGFGAGVQTELEGDETLSYGDDGSMIITGLDLKIGPLTYLVGTVSDHILTLPTGEEISLRDLCGKSAMVTFSFRDFFFLDGGMIYYG